MPRHKPDPVASMALVVAILVIVAIILMSCAAPPRGDCRDELRYRPGGMYLQEVCE